MWVDEFELRAGDSLTERVSGALTSADFVVALVSASAVASNWCRRELQIALSHGLSEGRTIVLPLRLGSVTMPAALADIVYVPADRADAEGAAERLVRDMCSHADEVAAKRASAVTDREWEFALQPAHELDDLLGDLEQEMSYLFFGSSRKGQTTLNDACGRWSMLVDKWALGDRLPRVLSELAWRLEGVLEMATNHDAAYRTNKGIRRRLEQIVASAFVEIRALMSAATQNPRMFANSALEECSIPEREDLMAIVRADPRLFTLHELIVPPAIADDASDVEPDA